MPCYYYTQFTLFNIFNLIQLVRYEDYTSAYFDTSGHWNLGFKRYSSSLSPSRKKGAGLYTSHIFTYTISY